MGIAVFDTPPEKHMEHDFSQRDFNNVKSEFIHIFNRLTQGQKGLKRKL